MQSLTASNNLLALNQRRMVVVATVADKPKLLVEGLLSGAYAWKFEMPVLVTYKLPPFDDKPQSHFENALVVTVLVQRQKILQSYKGLGIVQMIDTLSSSAPQALEAAPTE
jgi:intracellular multiplication protein IcmL